VRLTRVIDREHDRNTLPLINLTKLVLIIKGAVARNSPSIRNICAVLPRLDILFEVGFVVGVDFFFLRIAFFCIVFEGMHIIELSEFVFEFWPSQPLKLALEECLKVPIRIRHF